MRPADPRSPVNVDVSETPNVRVGRLDAVLLAVALAPLAAVWGVAAYELTWLRGPGTFDASCYELASPWSVAQTCAAIPGLAFAALAARFWRQPERRDRWVVRAAIVALVWLPCAAMTVAKIEWVSITVCHPELPPGLE